MVTKKYLKDAWPKVAEMSDLEIAHATNYELARIDARIPRDEMNVGNCHEYLISVINVVEYFHQATLVPDKVFALIRGHSWYE